MGNSDYLSTIAYQYRKDVLSHALYSLCELGTTHMKIVLSSSEMREHIQLTLGSIRPHRGDLFGLPSMNFPATGVLGPH